MLLRRWERREQVFQPLSFAVVAVGTRFLLQSEQQLSLGIELSLSRSITFLSLLQRKGHRAFGSSSLCWDAAEPLFFSPWRVRESFPLALPSPSAWRELVRKAGQGEERRRSFFSLFQENGDEHVGAGGEEKKKEMEAPPLPPPLSERLVRACSSIKEHSVRSRDSSLCFFRNRGKKPRRGFLIASLNRWIDGRERASERASGRRRPLSLFIPPNLFVFRFFFFGFLPRRRAPPPPARALPLSAQRYGEGPGSGEGNGIWNSSKTLAAAAAFRLSLSLRSFAHLDPPLNSSSSLSSTPPPQKKPLPHSSTSPTKRPPTTSGPPSRPRAPPRETGASSLPPEAAAEVEVEAASAAAAGASPTLLLLLLPTKKRRRNHLLLPL